MPVRSAIRNFPSESKSVNCNLRNCYINSYSSSPEIDIYTFKATCIGRCHFFFKTVSVVVTIGEALQQIPNIKMSQTRIILSQEWGIIP